MNPVRTLATALATAALTISGLATTSAPATADPDPTTDRQLVECDSYFPSQVPCVRDTRHWSYDANGYAPSLIVRRNNDGVLVSREVTHARAHRLLHGTEPEARPAVKNIVTGTPAVTERRGCRTFKRYGSADDMNISQDSHYATVEVALTVTYRQCRPRRVTVTQEQVGFWLDRGDRMCRDGNDVHLYANPTSYGTYDSRTLTTKCYPDLERLFLTWNYPNGKGTARKGASALDRLSRCSTGDYGATIPRRANPSGRLNELCVRFNR